MASPARSSTARSIAAALASPTRSASLRIRSAWSFSIENSAPRARCSSSAMAEVSSSRARSATATFCVSTASRRSRSPSSASACSAIVPDRLWRNSPIVAMACRLWSSARSTVSVSAVPASLASSMVARSRSVRSSASVRRCSNSVIAEGRSSLAWRALAWISSSRRTLASVSPAMALSVPSSEPPLWASVSRRVATATVSASPVVRP